MKHVVSVRIPHVEQAALNVTALLARLPRRAILGEKLAQVGVAYPLDQFLAAQYVPRAVTHAYTAPFHDPSSDVEESADLIVESRCEALGPP